MTIFAYVLWGLALVIAALTQIGKEHDSPEARQTAFKICGFLVLFGILMYFIPAHQ